MATASVAVRLNAITGEFEKAFSNATRTVSGFERTFGNAASSIQGHQQAMNRAFAEFSGDKLTRDAAALSAAITQIGGAARLTEAEQRKVNATVTEAIAKYQALGQSAPAHLTALANATRQLEQPTTIASKAAGILGSAFAQFTLAGLAVSAINKLTGEISRFVSEGAKLPGLEASFRRLAQGIGQDSAAMLKSMQTASRGLVSELNLMQSANKAILLGLPVTAEQMGELAKTATVLGKAMGQDATKSLDDLITALGRSSPLILDNLGLTVKVGEANEKYARQLGKTSNELTDAERKMAFYNAAMDAARDKTKQLGDQTLTLGEIASIAWTKFGDAVTRAAGTANVGIGKILSSKNDLIQFLKDIAIFGSPGAAIAAAAERASQTSTTNEPRGGRPKSMLQQAREETAALNELRRSAQDLSEQALKPLTAVQKELALQFSKGGVGAKEIADKLNSVKTTAGVTETQISRLISAHRDGDKAGTKHAEALRKVDEKIADLTRGTSALTSQQRASIQEFTRLGLSAEDIALKMQLSVTTVKAYADEWSDLQKLVSSVIPRIKADISTLPVSLFPGAATLGSAIPTIPGSSLMAPLVAALERDFAGIDQAALKARNAIRDFGKNAADNTAIAEKEVEDNLRRIAGHIDAVFDPLQRLAADIPGIGGAFAQLGVQAAASFAKVTAGALTAQQAVQGLQAGAYGLLFTMIAIGLQETFSEARPVTQGMRDDFARQFGGRQGLELAALMSNTNLNSLDSQTSAAVFEQLTAPRIQREIEAQQAALDKYGLSWRDFGLEVRQAQINLNATNLVRDFRNLTKAGVDASKALSGMSGDLNQLIIDAVRSGTQIPRAMQPILEQLIRTRNISEEAARALLGIADDGMPALEDIRAAAERYGLTLDQLGPKVKQLEINEAAKQIAADFKLLTDAGADATVVAAAMVERIQDIINISFKTGAEVPIALKPIIEILINMGLLTDANGDKLENIDDINFGRDLVSAVDLLIQKLELLIDTLNGVADAQDRVNGSRPNLGGNPPSGPAIPRPPGGTTPTPPPPDDGTAPDPNAPPPGARPGPTSFSPSTSTQSVAPFTSGQVVPTGGGGALTSTIIVDIDGRTAAAAVVPYIPGEVQRFGLA